MNWHNVFIGCIGLLALSTGQADVIYDNGLPNDAQWRNSDFSNQFGGQAADDFILGTDSSLTAITWYGSYLFTPQQPLPDDFTIIIYSDASGMPASSPLYIASLSGEVSRQFTGVVVNDVWGDFEMYRYDVSVQALALTADTRYWLSIVNNTSATTQFGGWAWAYNLDGDDPNFTGDATHRWIREGGVWERYGSSNLAFTLHGPAVGVPEPGTLALFLAGLLGLGLARSRA